MIYPLIGDYEMSVSRLDRLVKAPQFLGGVPVLNSSGDRLVADSGNYSTVYLVNVKGKKMALRCWIKNPGNVKERYARVKSYLASNPTPYLVDFGYEDEGIIVKGTTYPISYMDWIDGKKLSQFIEENISNPTVINHLSEKFLALVEDLHSKKISHGDLQDGNIIVCKNANTFDLKLVDYDSLYTPSLQSWRSPDDLMGVEDYQHPQRGKKSNEKADYFSELVIYLSLLAYTEKPNLWKMGQEKRLLFTKADFENPTNSSTFKALKKLSPKIKQLADELKNFCAESDTNKLVPLEKILTGANKSAVTISPLSTTASLDSFFDSTPIPSITSPSYHPVTPTPDSQSDFSAFFGSSPAQPSPKHTSPLPQSTSPFQSKNSTWQNLLNWLSVSSYITVTPLRFWKTLFVSVPLSGLVAWVTQQSDFTSDFFIITLLLIVTPLSYLLTKNKLSIFLSLWGVSVFDYFTNYFSGGWEEFAILSAIAVIGALGFSGISSPRISFIRIFTVTGLTPIIFIAFAILIEGLTPTNLSFIPFVLGVTFTATITSILLTKFFGRG